MLYFFKTVRSEAPCLSSLLPLTGSPLQFYVDAINSGHVTAYGPGLSHGMVNKPAIFTIVTKDAGEGIFLTQKPSKALLSLYFLFSNAFSSIMCKFYYLIGFRGFTCTIIQVLFVSFVLFQVDCLWQWKVRLKQRSAVRTIKTAHALSPTCPPHQETIISSSNLTTSTSLGAPLQPRLQVCACKCECVCASVEYKKNKTLWGTLEL